MKAKTAGSGTASTKPAKTIADAASTKGADTDADEGAEGGRHEDVRFCKQHGPVSLARARALGPGKFVCPEPGCKRFLGTHLAAAPSGSVVGITDAELTQDPELRALRKDLEAARLKTEIKKATAPLQVDLAMQRLVAVEQAVKELRTASGEISEHLHHLQAMLNETPTFRLKSKFVCSGCGEEGYLGVKIQCGKCQKEVWWGWFPE